jgi:hypothetical protein
MKTELIKEILKKYKGKPLGEVAIASITSDIQQMMLDYLKSIKGNIGEGINGYTERCVVWNDQAGWVEDIDGQLPPFKTLDEICKYLETIPEPIEKPKKKRRNG